MANARRPSGTAKRYSATETGQPQPSPHPIKHRTRRAPDVPLGQVRLSHLLGSTPRSEPDKFITVRIPKHILEAVRQVAKIYATTNAEAVIALLNEGLDAARKRKLI